MIHTLSFEPQLEDWISKASDALRRRWHPGEVAWISSETPQNEFSFSEESESSSSHGKATQTLSKNFRDLADSVSCHSDPERWKILYRLLWRLKYENPHLLKIYSDPDCAYLNRCARQVGREIHKMRAFVRFKKVRRGNDDWFYAWFEPQFKIVVKNAPFFMKRFHHMNWSILTPDKCLHWNQNRLEIKPGIPKAPEIEDEVESLWIDYFVSIFNPARVKVDAMKKELPVYYWKNLPEAEVIPNLLKKAHSRVQSMMSFDK